MPTVFVCYRRGDTADLAGRLHDRLAERFGDGSVFFDVDTVPRGTDFRVHMLEAVKTSDVVLALIGPHWLDGGRLHQEHDYVRIELETALAHRVPIIPVLIASATMPSAGDLPASLASLAYLNAGLLQSGTDFGLQVARLLNDVEALQPPSRPARRPWKLAAAATVFLGLGLAGIIGLWRILPTERNDDPSVSGVTPKSPAPIGKVGIASVPPTDSEDRDSYEESETVQVAEDTNDRRLPGPGFATAEEALEAIARAASSALRQRGEFQIAVDRFHGPRSFLASGGPRLEKVLIAALTKAELAAVDTASATLVGSYSVVSADANAGGERRLGVALEIRMLDSLGAPFEDVRFDDAESGISALGNVLRTTIWDEREVCHLAGATAALPPTAGSLERSRRLAEALDQPTVSVDEERVSAADYSPYSISVRTGSEPLRPANLGGLAFVNIAEVDSYELVLHNESDLEAAAEVSIDGLNVFAFSRNVDERGVPRFRRFIIPAKSDLTLRGWQIDENSVEQFVLAEYSDSSSSLIADDVDFGTITATFSAAWPQGERAPSDEPAPIDEHATGAGPVVDQSFAEVARDVGVVRSVVSVRYDR